VDIGICTGRPEESLAARLVDAGCDYYEPTVAGALMKEGREEFDAGVETWAVGGLAPLSANVFLPADLSIVGPAVDGRRVTAYVQEAVRRARAVGIERIVFGSGGARRVPDGFPAPEAQTQLASILRLAAEAAAPGIVVCLEHLRKAETNSINSLAEAGALVEELAVENLCLVVDGYHLEEEGEDPAVVLRFADRIAHAHVCGPHRQPPGPGDARRLGALFEQLAAIAYKGRCSIECSWTDLDAEAPAALAAVRTAAERAGMA
jgi:D-psicose/D-tagatose/L-ribulose 3-epimerase